VSTRASGYPTGAFPDALEWNLVAADVVARFEKRLAGELTSGERSESMARRELGPSFSDHSFASSTQ
jgi:hypothetical protein